MPAMHSRDATRNREGPVTMDLLKIGELIEPLFEHLPEIPVGEWHRFSFDVVQMKSGVQVAHIRFQPISANPTDDKHG
jgi:hypothetical protein